MVFLISFGVGEASRRCSFDSALRRRVWGGGASPAPGTGNGKIGSLFPPLCDCTLLLLSSKAFLLLTSSSDDESSSEEGTSLAVATVGSPER